MEEEFSTLESIPESGRAAIGLRNRKRRRRACGWGGREAGREAGAGRRVGGGCAEQAALGRLGEVRGVREHEA
ncbi:unnamed protein product [Rangifer tarandus platyrhynchus]|uniref:Uncharacterized protein n=1 Tax=Rangifer tarandus platyrhynchus TaxID=3082113 RepID=A0AC59YCB8_RANTA